MYSHPAAVQTERWISRVINEFAVRNEMFRNNNDKPWYLLIEISRKTVTGLQLAHRKLIPHTAEKRDAFNFHTADSS